MSTPARRYVPAVAQQRRKKQGLKEREKTTIIILQSGSRNREIFEEIKPTTTAHKNKPTAHMKGQNQDKLSHNVDNTTRQLIAQSSTGPRQQLFFVDSRKQTMKRSTYIRRPRSFRNLAQSAQTIKQKLYPNTRSLNLTLSYVRNGLHKNETEPRNMCVYKATNL